MKLTHQHPLLFLVCAALLIPMAACRRGVSDAEAGLAAATTKPVPPSKAPTKERLVKRAQERWNSVMKNDLVAAYDFQAPEAKREQALASYLNRLAKHRYENARVDEVLAIRDDLGFVRVSTLWTPIDEMTRRVKLEPGQTLTQDITMIETWRFVDGDWCYVRPQIDIDFFQDHPELLRAEEAQAAKPSKTPEADSEGQ